MGCLMLYGVGWTQRWGVSEASVPLIADEISRGGRNQTGRLPVLDPGTGDPNGNTWLRQSSSRRKAAAPDMTKSAATSVNPPIQPQPGNKSR